MEPKLGRILLYVKNMEDSVDFYAKFFGYEERREEGDRIVELICPNGGPQLALHQAGRGLKSGQVLIKLVFDVEDVEGFCEQCRQEGLIFGPVHQADGYVYANAQDPSKNNIAVSNKAFRKF